MSVKIGGYTFQGWYSYASTLDDKSGVYAIGCEKDGKHTVLDVGEAAKVKERVENHDRKDCWKKNCKGGTIKYAQHLTPNKQQAGRKEIEKEIREKENPPCGET